MPHRPQAGSPVISRTLTSAASTLSDLAMRSSETSFPRSTERLLRDHLPGTAKLGRKILQLWQTVPHWQYGFGIIDMDAGREFKRRNRRHEDIDEADRRMIGHQVAAAFRAIFALAQLRLLKCPNMFGSGRDPHCLRLPKAEGVHRPSRPGTAGAAMTVAHGLRRPHDLQFNCAAEAISKMGHVFSFQGYRCRSAGHFRTGPTATASNLVSAVHIRGSGRPKNIFGRQRH